MTLRYPPLRYRTSCHDHRAAEVRGLALGAKIGVLIWAVFLIGWWLT